MNIVPLGGKALLDNPKKVELAYHEDNLGLVRPFEGHPHRETLHLQCTAHSTWHPP